MPPDGTLQVGTQVNLANLRAGMAEAQAAVKQASENMAAAQLQFGRAAEQGNTQAAAALKLYQVELQSAQSALNSFTSTEERETQVLRSNISMRMAASAELNVVRGNLMGSTRAAGALLAMLPGLGNALQAAFPVFGAVALVEILGQATGKVIDLWHAWDDVAQAEIRAHDAFDGLMRSYESETKRAQELIYKNIGDTQGKVAELGARVSDLKLTIKSDDSTAIDQARQKLDDLQQRSKAVQYDFDPLKGLSVDPSTDARAASKGIPNAETALDTAVLKQKNDQRELIDLIHQQGVASEEAANKAREASERAANKAREAEQQRLSFERETGVLIDSEAKKELDAYTKLAQLKNRGGAGAGRLEVDPQDAKTLDDYVKSQSDLWEAQTKGFEASMQQTAAINEAEIRYQEATGQISRLAAAYAMGAEHARQFAQQIQYLKDVQSEQTKSGNVGGAAQTGNQIKQLQSTAKITGMQDQAQAAQQVAQPWVTAATQVSDAWIGAFNKILVGGRESWYAVREAGQQMTMALIGDAEKQLQHELEMQLRKLAAHVVTNQGIVASNAGAAAQSETISLTQSIKEATHAAGVAAANTWAAVSAIPIVGPVLAPPAAGAAYAGVLALAAFDTGTSYIPRDGVAMLHKGEAVLPPPQTEALLTALGGRGGSDSGQASQGIRDINFSPTYHTSGSTGKASLRDFAKVLRRANLLT